MQMFTQLIPHDEAVKAQAIITNTMCHIPQICNDRGMFLVEHELGEDKMQELLNEVGLVCGVSQK